MGRVRLPVPVGRADGSTGGRPTAECGIGRGTVHGGLTAGTAAGTL